jgi:cysteinyl-tRNA synthetase
MTWNRLLAELAVGFTALAAAAANAQSPASRVETTAALAQVRTWAYQLQNISAARLASTPYDLLVIDGLALAGNELAKLKRKPDGSRRLVLGYVNIGEAEDYRYYWQSAWERSPPAWLGSANCRWKGDHRVRFWMPGWRDLVFGSARSYVGRIVAAGFDGVFLVRVDIHRHWLKENPQATTDMVAFVSALAGWSRTQRPGFLIVPQNGEELLEHASYRAVIDAQAKEDLLFGNRGNDIANASPRDARVLERIGLAKADGRPVFVIEYIKQPQNIASADARLKELGFIAYYGPRSLSRIGIGGPEHPEDRNTEPVTGEQGEVVEAAAGGCK